jgi:hypothetical protein
MSDQTKGKTAAHPATFTDSRSRKAPLAVSQENLTPGADTVCVWAQRENGDVTPLVVEAGGRLRTTTSISSGTVTLADNIVIDEKQLERLSARICASTKEAADRTVTAMEALSKSIDELVVQLVALVAR